MATTYYLRDTASDINPGAELEKLLSTARGAAAVLKDTFTVDGPTAGVQLTNGLGGAAIAWFTPPLQAVTIAGIVTFNYRGKESGMNANAGPQVKIERCNTNGVVISTIVNSEQGTEFSATAEAAHNWTATPTSTPLVAGDRLKVTLLGNDAGGTMATGFTFIAWWDGPTAGASGDTYVTFTETILEQTGVVDISASISGAGALSGLVAVAIPVTGSLSGVGALGGVAAVVTDVAGALSGSGALSGGAVVATPVAAALSGSGILSAAATIAIPVTASLSGTGTLAGAATLAVPVSASLSGVGALAADVTVAVPVSGSLSGSGSLAGAAVVATPIAAALTGSGALVGGVIMAIPVTGSLSGSGVLTADAIIAIPVAGSLTGSGALTADVTIIAGSAPEPAPAPSGGGMYGDIDILDYWRPRRPVWLGAVDCLLCHLEATLAIPEVIISARSGMAGIWLLADAEAEILTEIESRTLLLPGLQLAAGAGTMLQLGLELTGRSGGTGVLPPLWGVHGLGDYTAALRGEREAREELELVLALA